MGQWHVPALGLIFLLPREGNGALKQAVHFQVFGTVGWIMIL